jgi:hypothetical protein
MRAEKIPLDDENLPQFFSPTFTQI